MLHALGAYNSSCLQKQLTHYFDQQRAVAALLLLPVTATQLH